jgi:putative colanic acid biosynthesis acetyltransferase WcaF
MDESDITPVINLAEAPGERGAWDRPSWLIYVWALMELLFVTNAWQPSSKLRIGVLRMFGAEIGVGVIFRPRTRVKFPWKLHVGDRCWIGEGVWFHNQDHITLEHDVVVSQDSFLTTGTHDLRRDMALLTRPIRLRAGAWITSRCIVLGGADVGRSSVARPMTLVTGVISDNVIVSSLGTELTVLGPRFPNNQRRLE